MSAPATGIKVALSSFARVLMSAFIVASSCVWFIVLWLPGAALFGMLPGVPDDDCNPHSCAEFAANASECWNSNVELLESLREDSNSSALHELAKADHALGRMSKPVPVEKIDLCSARSADLLA